MFEFHADKQKYFRINIATTKQYIIPFIEERFSILPGMRVLEIGCGEGGVIRSFLDLGLTGVGVELDEVRLKDASIFLKEEIEEGKIRFISKDIYKTDVHNDLGGKFDIIILKDVIEHIPDQEKLLAFLKAFLNPNGVIFFGFPPWQMPLGGHQQILKNKWLSKIPYYHLLPMYLYKKILSAAGENVQEMEEIKSTGISIEKFEKIVANTNYSVINKRHFLINPIYEHKFGWKPIEQWKLISSLPVVRNFVTTCVYYLVQSRTENKL